MTETLSSPEVPLEPTRERGRTRSAHVAGFLIPLAAMGVIAFLAPVLPIPDPNFQDLSSTFQPPVGFGGTWEHPLGTDQLGRDELSRLIWGGRLTFVIAILGVTLAGILGASLGIAAGYQRGWLDVAVTRLVDAQLALPFLLLAIAIISARGQSLTVVVGVLSIAGWAQYTRVLRAETLALRERPFVVGLRSAGLPASRIMVSHILPNVLNSLLVIATLEVGVMILGEGALSFLGLGVVAPSVSWGLMLAESREYLEQAWWVVVFPGVAIGIVVLLSNLGGDALRAKYDPQKRTYQP